SPWMAMDRPPCGPDGSPHTVSASTAAIATGMRSSRLSRLIDASLSRLSSALVRQRARTLGLGPTAGASIRVAGAPEFEQFQAGCFAEGGVRVPDAGANADAAERLDPFDLGDELGWDRHVDESALPGRPAGQHEGLAGAEVRADRLRALERDELELPLDDLAGERAGVLGERGGGDVGEHVPRRRGADGGRGHPALEPDPDPIALPRAERDDRPRPDPRQGVPAGPNDHGGAGGADVDRARGGRRRLLLGQRVRWG